MKIEEYFDDSSLVVLSFNGEEHNLEEYKNIKKNRKYKVLYKEIAKYINVKLFYANKLVGNIEGYILDFSELQKYLNEGILDNYIEDIYWDLDYKWENLSTFLNLVIDNKFSFEKIYFVIKNIIISNEFKDDGVEQFFVNKIKEIINDYTNIYVNYLVVINDSSKFKLSDEKFNLKIGEKLKFLILKNIKRIKYIGKEIKEDNIVNIAKKTNFDFLETGNKDIKLWIKE